MDRRLAAILVCDRVASTAECTADEEQGLRRIAEALDLVGNAVQSHGGRIFNTAGDGLLAEFASPVNALRAAMEGRAAIGRADPAGPDRMRFGLHLADVVAIGDDLRGTGVNLAARIQAAAEPGSIELSGAIYEHVRRNSPSTFDDLGEKRFEGIADPVRVLRVRGEMDRHRFFTVATGAARRPEIKENSVAVLPFRVASSADEDQQFLADGLTDDLILELSRLHGLFVISRSASVALEGLDAVEAGARLGVRHVLAGSVRRLGSRVRLNVTLTDAATGAVVWSERVEDAFDRLLDVMDDITARVAASVLTRVEDSALRAARLKRPENMTAYEYYLRGLEHHRMGGVTSEHVHEALKWFGRACEADPTFGRPLAMTPCSWSYLPDFDIAEAERMIERALVLDPTDPEAHRIMGMIQIYRHRDFAAARRYHEKAMQMAPNDAYMIGRCAALYTFIGEAERALDILDRASMLDPLLPVWVTEERLAALYALGRFEEMLAEARALSHQTRRSRLYRAAARVAIGDLDRARQHVADALAADPGLSCEYVRGQEHYEDDAVIDELVSRCRTAGLPLAPGLRLAAV